MADKTVGQRPRTDARRGNFFAEPQEQVARFTG